MPWLVVMMTKMEWLLSARRKNHTHIVNFLKSAFSTMFLSVKMSVPSLQLSVTSTLDKRHKELARNFGSFSIIFIHMFEWVFPWSLFIIKLSNCWIKKDESSRYSMLIKVRCFLWVSHPPSSPSFLCVQKNAA